jgi:hypothetical protein
MIQTDVATAALVAVLLSGACGAARPVQLPDATRSREHPAAEDTKASPSLAWSESRRLSWSDFLGMPQMASEASATTAYVISCETECDGDTFTFRVTTMFLPDRSWVKPGILSLGGPSRRILLHEQTHFDLGEVHARELRRALGELQDPCTRSRDERNAIIARVLRVDEEAQHRYDLETESGANLSRQAEWDSRVERQLSALRRYAKGTGGSLQESFADPVRVRRTLTEGHYRVRLTD